MSTIRPELERKGKVGKGMGDLLLEKENVLKYRKGNTSSGRAQVLLGNGFKYFGGGVEYYSTGTGRGRCT